MGNVRLIVVLLLASSANMFGQAAVSSSANAQDRTSPSQVLPPNPPDQVPLASPTPNVPSLEQLDQLFKQTSLGKTADEARLHLQWRELSNRTINDPDLV